MTAHHLTCTPQTCHIGFFDASRAAQTTIASGDTITIDTLTGTVPMIAMAPGYTPPEMKAVREQAEAYPAAHILTGPVAVSGAEPGDVLEVRILDVKLRQDWGFNLIRPIAGTLPDDFTSERLMIIPIDRETKTCKLPFGLTLPLSPFFGVMGLAPPASWGRITSVIPRAHGGNIDNKELGAGATLYLPVHVAGAMFSCGDGHGVQGDGEVCLTALETALTGTFQLIVRKDMKIATPRAETTTHLISMGFDPSLDRAMETALRQMIAWLGERNGLSPEDAYSLCSLIADFRVTQTVNGSKGIHGMLAKAIVDSRP
ncbi:MAG: acetamidase/formamidase family protein [Hyphomicrobiales bacterium]|nr:acetamidase/formamidase family protein [Hyphomicrobiales bacterium]